MDGQTNGQKKCGIEVGAPPKNIFLINITALNIIRANATKKKR